MYHQSLKLSAARRNNLDMAVACGCPGASYVVTGEMVSDVTYMFEDEDIEIQDVADLAEIENWGCEVVAVSEKKEM